MTARSAISPNDSDLPAGSPPVALTIAGSDSSGGAGIQADLKTFSALGVYGLTAVTCVVAEAPGKVSSIESVTVAMVRDQIEVLARTFPIRAIKTGLLRRAEIVSAVASIYRTIREQRSPANMPLVVDPVMIATSGAQLLEPKAMAAYEAELLPLATLITPNLDEASQLSEKPISDHDSMKEAASSLAARFGTSVLIKGGHLRGGDAVDWLASDGRLHQFRAPWIPGVSTHGTGCTYSAAITAGLAQGLSLLDAIVQAKTFVTAAIQNHWRWDDVHALRHSI